MFKVISGMVSATVQSSSTASTAGTPLSPPDIYGTGNGDDWFFYDFPPPEHQRCANKKTVEKSSIVFASVSGVDTTLLRLRTDAQPHHEVLHEGSCTFAGLKPADLNSETDPDAPSSSRFHVQAM